MQSVTQSRRGPVTARARARLFAGGRRAVAVAATTWVVATVLLLGTVVVASSHPEELSGAARWDDPAWLLGLVVVTGQALVLTGASRHAARTLVGVAVGAPLGGLVGLGPAIGCTSVAVIVAAFAAATAPRTPTARLALVLSCGALLVAAGELIVQSRADASLGQAIGASLVQGVGTVGLSALAGLLVASRRDTRAALAEGTRAAAGERAALVQAAVAGERAAMARELHDIAAHHLTGIVVMSGAISRQIDQDPEGAKQAVDQVREQSKSMLRDMRGLVGLLRPGREGVDRPDGAVPQESFDGIAALVDAAAQRGEPVDLEILAPTEKDPRDGIGPLAQLSAYRTVQESLTNAARHAPGAPCRVVLDLRSPDRAVVSVANEASAAGLPRPLGSSGGGFGLVGMRERAELTDSRLTAGPTERGWLVRLAIPVRDQPRLTTEDPA